MIDYILEHWLEWLFAILASLAAYGYRNVTKKLQEEREHNKFIGEGVQSLLRESIVDNYNKYQDKGFCPIYAKESIKNVYRAYHNLGGNDIATNLYHKLLEMPEEKEDDDAKQGV